MHTDCFLHWQTQLLVWHWATTSYASHVAFVKAYKSFSKLIDAYIETYQGENIRLGIPTFESCPEYVGVKKASEKILWFKSYLIIDLIKDLDKTKDVDLFTLRDEMVGELNHLSYLLSLE